MSNTRLVLSDLDTQIAKNQIKEKILEIWEGLDSIEDKRDTYWEEIVDPGWSSEIMADLFLREGYTDALLEFENQLHTDVMKDLGYDITDGFC